MLEFNNNFTFFDETDATIITPEMAQALLDSNACIKPLHMHAVAKLVRELKNGNFDFNGATIVLNEEARLIDGRARLTACVEAGIPIKAFIVTGIDRTAQYTKDTGRSRNIAQYLGTHGYSHPRVLSAVATIIHTASTIEGDYDGIIERSRDPITQQEILNIIESHPNLVECVNRIVPHKREYITTATNHLIALDYLCRYHDNCPELADEFLEVLSGNRVVEMDHPVYQLRVTFISSLQSTNQKLVPNVQVMYMIKAYNLLKEGKQCKRLYLGSKTPRLFFLNTKSMEDCND